MKLSRLPFAWYALAAAILLADQTIKTYIEATTPLGWSRSVTDFFNLVHVLNSGAAFSFLAGAGGWQRWFFLAIAIVVSTWLVVMLARRPPQLESAAYSLIMGGALGNAVDRMLRGYVIDFLDFHWGDWHWPAFNIADMAIVSGAAVMLLAAFLTQLQSPKEQSK